MRKTILTWITVFTVASSGLFVMADDEKKDDDGKGRPERERDGKGKDKGDRIERIKRIFAHLDEDESGTLSLQEFAKAKHLEDASRREIKEIFEKKDLDGDGEIGKGEFARTFGPPRAHGKGGPPRGKGKGKGGPPRGKGGKGGKDGA